MNISKDNTIIVFDLHSVIFTFDYKKVAKILWHFDHKWAIIATLFRLGLIWQILKLLWHDATDEEFYNLFEQKRPILLPLIVNMTNAQKIIPGMDQIIKELAQQGYTLHILSNIGPRRFEQLKSDFPQLLSYFKKAKIVNLDEKSHPLKKPNPKFFSDYINEYKNHYQNIILIDDKKENIKVAQSLGMSPILFKSSKQLRSKLINLGIIEK